MNEEKKIMEVVQLEDEEREDLEIRGCRRLQQEWEREELQHGMDRERRVEKKKKFITLGPERCENIKTLYINNIYSSLMILEI